MDKNINYYLFSIKESLFYTLLLICMMTNKYQYNFQVTFQFTVHIMKNQEIIIIFCSKLETQTTEEPADSTSVNRSPSSIMSRSIIYLPSHIHTCTAYSFINSNCTRDESNSPGFYYMSVYSSSCNLLCVCKAVHAELSSQASVMMPET